MHLHGHNFFVLDEGYGYVNDTRLAELSSLTNPTRRDTHIMRQAQDANTPWYTVIQFDTDNPGVWPLHCHRAWHTSLGFLVNILVSANLFSRASNAVAPRKKTDLG